MKASAGNTFEMEQAKLALERATDPRLKAFAQTMPAGLVVAKAKEAEAVAIKNLKSALEGQ